MIWIHECYTLERLVEGHPIAQIDGWVEKKVFWLDAGHWSMSVQLRAFVHGGPICTIKTPLLIRNFSPHCFSAIFRTWQSGLTGISGTFGRSQEALRHDGDGISGEEPVPIVVAEAMVYVSQAACWVREHVERGTLLTGEHEIIPQCVTVCVRSQ